MTTLCPDIAKSGIQIKTIILLDVKYVTIYREIKTDGS